MTRTTRCETSARSPASRTAAATHARAARLARRRARPAARVAQIEDSIGWPRRRIASVLAGVAHLRHTEFGGREAVIPTDRRLLRDIHAQQREVRARFPAGPWPWL